MGGWGFYDDENDKIVNEYVKIIGMGTKKYN